jgi:hypothetical protein
MTDLARIENDVSVPGSGELVDLRDPIAVARALDTLREYERMVREVKEVLADRLREERHTQGVRQLDYDGITVKFSADTETRYDAEGLEDRLRAAGMPEARIGEIVVQTVERKVKAVEAKRAAAVNPAYAEAVELSREIVEKRQTVTVEIAR